MSNLTKKEKQALNDLFLVLKERENLFYRIINIKKSLNNFYNSLLKHKKAKNPTV